LSHRADALHEPGSWPVHPSLFGLAPCGVYPACGVTVAAVRSYRTFSPLPLHGADLWTRSSALAKTFVQKSAPCNGGMFSVALAVCGSLNPHPGRYPAHCPAEFGLSSPGTQSPRPRQRPPGPPAAPSLLECCLTRCITTVCIDKLTPNRHSGLHRFSRPVLIRLHRRHPAPPTHPLKENP